MQHESNPMISVIMPVYNGEKYLKEAIDSILNQTYGDFELIILNDGSTDYTEEIILSYDDPRIAYVENDKNLQIVQALNKGIELAKGKYIARMDADDISLPERFGKQINFMENNTDIDVCGTWMQALGSKTVWEYPESHNEICASMLFNTPISHPSVLMKKSFFENILYDETYNKAEDYALWLSTIDTKKFVNIPIVLYQYRLHEEMTNIVARDKQIKAADRVRQSMFSKLKLIPTKNEWRLHKALVDRKLDINDFLALIVWIEKIVDANNRTGYFDEEGLILSIREYLWQLHSQNTWLGLVVFRHYFMLAKKYRKKMGPKKTIRFFVKCMLHYKYKK